MFYGYSASVARKGNDSDADINLDDTSDSSYRTEAAESEASDSSYTTETGESDDDDS